MRSTEREIDIRSRIPMAVLIDADNVEADAFPSIYKAINSYGDPIIRRIYGDWSSNHMNKWKNIFRDYSIVQKQVPRNTACKNSTDIFLAIDAMELLYTNEIEIFCIVSSDSDYTHLVSKLREKNKYLIGVGHKDKVNKGLVSSYERFIYYNKLSSEGEENDTDVKDTLELREDKELIDNIKGIIEETIDEDNRVNIGNLKKRIVKLMPDFDSKNYGYKRFSDVIEEIGYWELCEDRKVLLVSEDDNKKVKKGTIRSTGKQGFGMIDGEEKNIKFEYKSNPDLNPKLINKGDKILYEINEKGKAINVRYFGELCLQAKYGFIKGRDENEDIFIPEKEMKELRKEKVKLYDILSYQKKEPENNGKSLVAYNIKKIQGII